jgi:hypothetical protein
MKELIEKIFTSNLENRIKHYRERHNDLFIMRHPKRNNEVLKLVYVDDEGEGEYEEELVIDVDDGDDIHTIGNFNGDGIQQITDYIKNYIKLWLDGKVCSRCYCKCQKGCFSNLCDACNFYVSKNLFVYSQEEKEEENNEYKCDLCYELMIEPNVGEETYYYREMLNVKCCKGKMVCENCVRKLKENNDKAKCPFCKQDLKLSHKKSCQCPNH